VSHGLARSVQSRVTALQKLNHIAPERYRRQLVTGGIGFDIAKIRRVGSMEIDDAAGIINSTDSFLVLSCVREEFHLWTPPAATT
jgi:hypothetical protein